MCYDRLFFDNFIGYLEIGFDNRDITYCFFNKNLEICFEKTIFVMKKLVYICYDRYFFDNFICT